MMRNLAFVGFLFLWACGVTEDKKEKQSDSSIILSVISLNKYISSFARVYRSLTVLAFYENPKVIKIIDSQREQ